MSRIRCNNLHAMRLAEFSAQTTDKILDTTAARRIVPRDNENLHAKTD